MMRKIVLVFSALLSGLAAIGQTAQMLQVKELKLSNGLTVWLNEDHTQAKVYGAVVVKAGAKDCPGTGIAHYFEHIMFKGTDRIGTVDYEAERPWLDSISAQYDLLSQTKDGTQRAAIQEHINELSLKASEYAIPNEFSRLISHYGGSSLNAATSYDVTYYHNTFLPQYIVQWCWLNSERLIHPVFRGFQAELENVYEEKNRSSDGMGGALETVMGTIFKDHPYGQAILGTTESLKNPRLSDMEAFFKKYYVASNMGLILCGDIDAATLQPLLEKTFGRVQTGPVPTRNIQSMPSISKGTRAEVKLPIPLIKAQALVSAGPTDYAPDAVALTMANSLLTNGKAGYLDSLMNEHVVMMAMAGNMALNDAGVEFLAAIPKLPFGKKQKAIDACLAQMDRIKRGDFSNERLEQLKQEALLQAEASLETIEDRAAQMIDAFAQGQTWTTVLQQLETMKNLKREDVISAANKYFSDEYITFVKKFGIDKKETLKQPGYKPIEPKNADAKSDFACQLEQIPVDNSDIRTIDMKNDATRTIVNPHVTLYTKENPLNDIFTFTLSYLDGTRHTPLLSHLSSYLSELGTDSLKKQQLEAEWLRLGVTLTISSTPSTFNFSLKGRDGRLADGLKLLAHFLSHVQADNKVLKELKQTVKVDDKSFGKEKDNVMSAMLLWAIYGENSNYLRQPSVKEVKALKDEQFMTLLEELKQYDCEINYCGRLPIETVVALSKETLPLQLCVKPRADIHYTMQQPDADMVFFYHVPKSRQNYVGTYESLGSIPSWEGRAIANLWGQYMGGGMSSVLFQNVREFRSLAYSTGGRLLESDMARHQDDPVAFYTMTGTQADKTLTAMHTVDSLLHHLPVNSANIEASRQEVLNDIQSNFPTFREMGTQVAALYRTGYSEDPNRQLARWMPTLRTSDVEQFHQQHVAPNKRIWLIIGDRKLINLKQLEKYGKMVELSKEDIFR